MSWFRTLAREPLVHFLVVGAGLFALDAVASPAAEDEGPRSPRIVVDAGIREELRDGFTHAYGRPPSDAEMHDLVERWVDEEVLFREGLARRLDQDDPRIRARIASMMGFVLENAIAIAEPSEEQLRERFERERSMWDQQPLVSFTHVFVQGDDADARARAQELLSLLRQGAAPAGLGDVFQGGQRYRRRRIDQLASAFGPSFAEGLDEQPLDEWVMRTSRFGLHLVRVERRVEAQAAEFEAVRLDVASAWEHAERAVAMQRAIAELRTSYAIEYAP